MYFAKHETFHIRDGWLFKGLDAIEQSPGIFLEEDAPERLGLGKNMVRALRYWMQATGLTIEEQRNRTKEQDPTLFGRMVYEHDPYLELDGTLWLIHYYLISNKELATTWYWFFNHYAPGDFRRDDFVERLAQWINLQNSDVEDATTVSEKSLHKDFDCLTRTYLPGQRERSPEDQLECPLSSLGLLTATRNIDEETGKRFQRYHQHMPDIASIHPLVFLFVILNQQEQTRSSSHQVSLTATLRETGGAGRIFNIGIVMLEDLLVRLDNEYPDWRIKLIRTGGLDQITLPEVSSEIVLTQYYEEMKWS